MLDLLLRAAGECLTEFNPSSYKRPGGDYSFSEVGSLSAKGLPCCCCFDVGRTEIAKHLIENLRGFICARCSSEHFHVIILLILITTLKGGVY